MITTTTRKQKNKVFDWPLFIIVTILCTIGLLNNYSASIADSNTAYRSQGIWILLGTLGATILALQDYRLTQRLSYLFYTAALALLAIVPFVGVTRNGSTRWIDFGSFDAQPSEIMKVAIILVTARYFHDHETPEGHSIFSLFIPFALLFAPIFFIFRQPDLGTTLVIIFIFMTMLLFEGVQKGTLFGFGITGLVGALPFWFFGMKEYQKERVMALLYPERYALDESWHPARAQVAIGSGKWFGKGFLKGTQVQNGWVPFHENDFIFAHTGEQFGFVGSVILILLYFSLIVWALRIARLGRDRFAVLAAVGISALFFWHIFINLAMVMGLLPVVGLWLPFASAGGSSTITIFMCVGLLMSISMRRFSFS